MVAAIAAISITGYSLALGYPLFGLLLARMGASKFEIGFNAAAPAVAMLAAGPFMPRVLKSTGLPALLVVAALSLAVSLILMPLFPGLAAWTALRFVHGVATVAMFYGSELWIVAASPPERRSLYIGVYGLFLSIGFFLGPVSLGVLGVTMWLPFLVSAGVAIASIAPVAWAWRDAPRDLGGPAQRVADVVHYFRSDPTVLWAVALFGAIEFGGFALFPVWAVATGLSDGSAVSLIALLALGNILLQVPMGMLGDRANRKALLACSASCCVLGASAMMAFEGTQWPLWITTLILGGTVVGLYTFALAELGARYAGDALARGAAAIMMAYGVGALAAPPVMGAAMDVLGPDGLGWVMIAGAGAYLTLVALRYHRRRNGPIRS